MNDFVALFVASFGVIIAMIAVTARHQRPTIRSNIVLGRYGVRLYLGIRRFIPWFIILGICVSLFFRFSSLSISIPAWTVSWGLVVTLLVIALLELLPRSHIAWALNILSLSLLFLTLLIVGHLVPPIRERREQLELWIQRRFTPFIIVTTNIFVYLLFLSLSIPIPTWTVSWGFVLTIIVLLRWAFLFKEAHYKPKTVFYWLAEIRCPTRLLLGDSYSFELRLRPMGFMNAIAATGGIPLAMYVPKILPVSFKEKPPRDSEFPEGLRNQSPRPMIAKIYAPGFDIAPSVIELNADEIRRSDWVSWLALPKTAGTHGMSIQLCLPDNKKIGEITLRLTVKQFFLFGRFGFNDRQWRAMQWLGILMALSGSTLALLKAFRVLA